MKPDAFHIEVLNKPNLTFSPGELIQGILHVVVGPAQKECVCKGIKLTFQGKAWVHWTESSGKAVLQYMNSEIYFDKKMYLEGTGTSDITLPTGKKDYPFEFILPQNIPTSFGPTLYGGVEYKIKAEIVTGALKSNHKSNVPFTVYNVADLNKHPKVLQPMTYTKSKSAGGVFHKSGLVGFTLTLPRSGYIPGEFINFKAEIKNESGKRVKDITAYLIQKVNYIAREKPNNTLTILGKSTGPAVHPGCSETWTGKNLQVPQVPPSLLVNGCKVIDVQYYLKMELHLSGVSINLRHEMPIMIGNIPIRSAFEGTKVEPNVNVHSQPSHVPNINNYPNLPPSYAPIRDPIGQVNVTNDKPNPSFEPNHGGLNNYNVPNLCPNVAPRQPENIVPTYNANGYGWNA